MYSARHAAPLKNHRAAGTLTAAALMSLAVPVATANAATAAWTPGSTTAPSDSALGYHLDAAHDGHLVGGSEAPGAPQKWSRDLGGNVSYPIIVKNHVFVTVAKTSGYGTVLHALDPKTGQDQWTADLGGRYWMGSLTYGGGAAYALNVDGKLRAFNPADGTVIWSEQLPGQYMFTAAPTYYNGTVYVSGAGSGGTVYAVDGVTGAIHWSQSVMNGDMSSPAVNATGVYVSYAGQQDYDFDPTTGAQIWHHTTGTEGGGGSTPVLGGGAVWASGYAADTPLSLDPATGAASPNSVPAGATYRDGTPAFDTKHGFYLVNGVLTAQDTDDPGPKWTFAGDGHLTSAPIVVHGYVYVGSSSGQVWAVSETTGAVAWTGNVGAPVLGFDSNVDRPITGLAAGQGMVLIPASTKLVAYGN